MILFELLTNQSPHGRGTADELRDRICGGPRVKLQEANPNRDRELGEIVDRAIAIKPNDRYESASVLEAALSKWLQSSAPYSSRKDYLQGAKVINQTVINSEKVVVQQGSVEVLNIQM